MAYSTPLYSDHGYASGYYTASVAYASGEVSAVAGSEFVPALITLNSASLSASTASATDQGDRIKPTLGLHTGVDRRYTEPFYAERYYSEYIADDTRITAYAEAYAFPAMVIEGKASMAAFTDSAAANVRIRLAEGDLTALSDSGTDQADRLLDGAATAAAQSYLQNDSADAIRTSVAGSTAITELWADSLRYKTSQAVSSPVSSITIAWVKTPLGGGGPWDRITVDAEDWRIQRS